MTIFNDINDIRRYLSDLYSGLDMECYDCSHSDLMDKVACDFRDVIKSCGYIYGEEFEESTFSDDLFWELLEQYEKTEDELIEGVK